MRQLISEFMPKVFGHFRRSTENTILCDPDMGDLKSIHYYTNRNPDYSKSRVQRLYLLRYFPAYLFEYKYIYNEIVKAGRLDTYNVLSIGCGAAIDFHGLHLALQRKVKNIYYTGIDITDWRYRPQHSHVNFINADIAAFQFNDSFNEKNIIIFPKSLSEINIDGIQNFIINLRKVDFSSDVIYLVSSCMDRNFQDDENKYKMILKLFVEKGYKNDVYRSTEEFSNKDIYLNQLDVDFFFPPDIERYLIRLGTKCIQYINNRRSCDPPECIDTLNRYPTKKNSYMSWQINLLERT